MKTLIHDYRNRPGEHCGSAAMRNLIHHHCGLDLSEAVVFGLGSGIDFLLFEGHEYEPGVLSFGRSATMETDVASALGIDYRERPEPDDERAWDQVRQEVADGRPTMLSGDIFYLDYRDYKVHFPAHRFVLVGFDDELEIAFVSDRVDPEPQPCSYRALRDARNPQSFISTHNLWGKFHDDRVGAPIEAAYATAIERSARRMLGRDDAELSPFEVPEDSALQISRGLAGLARFAEQLPDWSLRDDIEFLTSYTSRCIEKFGTGGGNFRSLYAEFLRDAHAAVPDLVDASAPGLAAQSSARWTELSLQLRELGETRTREVAERCGRTVSDILALETQLFESLAVRAAP
jgi:hypothetical protein